MVALAIQYSTVLQYSFVSITEGSSIFKMAIHSILNHNMYAIEVRQSNSSLAYARIQFKLAATNHDCCWLAQAQSPQPRSPACNKLLNQAEKCDSPEILGAVFVEKRLSERQLFYQRSVVRTK
jgi:hypothetical protein